MSARGHPRTRADEQGKKERNDRVFAVPDRSPLETDLKDVRHLPSRAREELERFFRATNALEDKETRVFGMARPKAGRQDHQAALRIASGLRQEIGGPE
jgi:inorganic pyrophosphatase